MFLKSKKLLLASALLVLSSCSGNKDLPQGKRISVLDMPASELAASKSASKSFSLSEKQTLKEWNQTFANAVHTPKNISASANMVERWSSNFGKGANKRNLLLASPVASNGVVFVQDVEGSVSAYQISDGKKLFKQKLKPLNKNDSSSALNGAGLALDAERLYALTGFGSVFALDRSSGKILWRKDLNIPLRTAPTVDQNKLFVQTIDNQLFCLDTSDGSEVWVYNISAEETVLAGGAAPAYDASKQIVVAAFSNGEIQAFNAQIGYPLWSNNLISTGSFTSVLPINAVKASPVIDSNVVYAIGNNNQMIAANLETGEIIWQKQIGGTSTPLVDKEAVFLVSNNMELTAMDKANGNILWQQPLLSNLETKERRELYVSAPLLINSELLLVTSSGLVLTFDPKTGKQKNVLDLGESLPFAPIAVDKNIIFVTNDAELIVYQ